MGKTDKISMRQLIVMIFLGLLSPIIRILPRSPIFLGGRATWLSPVPGMIVGLIYLIVLRALLKNRAPGEGLGQMFERSLGKAMGKVVSILCVLWLTLYTGFVLRSAAERLLSAVYGEGNTILFIIISIIIAVIAAVGQIKSFARTVELAMPIIVAVFILVLIFSATEIKIDYLLPVTYMDAGAIALGALPMIDIIGFSVFFMFLLGNAEKSKSDKKNEIRWMFYTMLAALGVMVVTVGGCSAELSLNLQNAFFTMIRNITVLGVVERVEALAVAIWVITDFTMLAAVLIITAEIWRGVFEVPKRKVFVYPEAVFASICSGVITQNAFDLIWWSEIAIPAGNIFLAFVLIPLVLFIGRLRKRI